MSGRAHWQGVYLEKASDEVSWYRPHLDTSLALIRATELPTSARVIDVGGGASTLVDDLVAAGFESITVLDLSGKALEVARLRLGDDADRIHWLERDITTVDLGEASFDLWHDRAVLHFLLDEQDQSRYVDTLSRSLSPGGHAILATFAPHGPPKCSGLPVCRYDAQQLAALVGDQFQLREQHAEVHVTPSGNEQPFTYVWLERNATG